MAERIVIQQNSEFEAAFWSLDPDHPESGRLRPVEHLHSLSPYGLLLAGLGSCTADILHTYALHHNIDLDEVEIALQYERAFDRDCVNCEDIAEYREHISMDVTLTGNLSPAQREKLFQISHHCPISKILRGGIEVRSHLSDQSRIESPRTRTPL